MVVGTGENIAEVVDQAAKCLELSATSHAAVAADKIVGADMEARGLEVTNNGRTSHIHHLLAARVGQWMRPKEPLPLTGMMHQNSGRYFQYAG